LLFIGDLLLTLAVVLLLSFSVLAIVLHLKILKISLRISSHPINLVPMIPILSILIISELPHFIIMLIDSLLKFLGRCLLFNLQLDVGALFLVLHLVFEPSFLILMPCLCLLCLGVMPLLLLLILFCIVTLHLVSFRDEFFLAPSLFLIKLTELTLVVVIAVA